jgi:hypothetical protein
VLVCDVLGIELSDEQKMMIDEMAEEQESQPPTGSPQMEEHNLGGGVEDEVAGEMLAWRKFAKKGHSREFETKHIPPALELRIRAGLKGGGDVDAVFDALANEPASIALARAINQAVAR